MLSQKLNIVPRPGDTVEHILAPTVVWSDDPDLQTAFVLQESVNQTAAVYALLNTFIPGATAGNPPKPAYDPIITFETYEDPSTHERHTYASRPRLEGLYGLKVPYGLAKAAELSGIHNFLTDPPPAAPPDVKAAFEKYRAARLGLYDQPLARTEAVSLSQELSAEVDQFLVQPALEKGLILARDIRLILLTLEQAGAGDLLPAAQAKLALFDTAFRALIAAQKAWWYAGEYTRLWADAAEATVNGNLTTLATAFTQIGGGAARSGFALLSDLALLLPGQRPVDLSLPGDLRIENVWGEVNYRSDTKVLSGAFGGRLELPAKQAFFEVVNGTINSTGAFSLTVSGGGPLPFAPDIKIDNVTGSVTGSTAGLSAFGASGKLHFPGASGDVSLDGAFSYTGAVGMEPAKVKFNAGITDAQNLPRFTDDLVLFTGAAAVEFPLTPTPPPVKISVSGKAGLFHRESPLVAPIVAEDFWMGVDLTGLEMLYQSVPAHRVTLTFNGGTLRFPGDLFFTKVTPPAVPQPFTIALGGGLTGCFDFDQQRLCFGDPSGGDYLLNLPTLGFFNIPGLPGSKVDVTTARLRFRQSEFPVLDQLTAGFKFPLPSESNAPAAAAFSLNATEWRIDGLPKLATLQLTQDLPLLPWLQQASLSVLNGASVTLTDSVNAARPGYRQMTLTASGAMRAGLDAKNISTEAGGAVALTTTGVFTWPFDYKPFQFGVTPTAPEPLLPSLTINDVTFDGRFRLGGANGFLIRGVASGPTSMARIRFSGGSGGSIENVLYRTAAKPFSIGLAGTLDVPAVGAFTIGDITDATRLTRFVWDQGGSVIPRFEPVGFNVAISGQVLRVADLIMPFYLTSAGMAFINGALPLLPGAGQTGLLDPSNLKIIASGVAQLPNGAAMRTGFPGLRGEFTNVAFTFPKVGGNYTAKVENLSSLTLEVRNLSVPYISDLSGGLTVRNIDALLASPSRPLDVYFAGQLTGKMRGAGGKVLLAASPRELIGACAGINGGVTGIPLDGYTLGGILLTGVEGGLSLQNSFSNPCDFWSYANSAAGAQQLPAPGSAARPGNPGPLLFPDPPGAPSSSFFDCTGPGFPPPTINPFCELHPDQVAFPGRIIFKGAWLTEAQLNSLGLSASDPRLQPTIAQGFDACAAGIEFAATQVASAAGAQILTKLQQLRTAAAGNANVVKLIDQMTNDALGIAGAAGAALDSKITAQLKELFRAGLMEAFEQGTTVNPNVTLYQLAVQRAREGIKCIDVTVRANATFTWQPVSIFFDVTGSAFLSTTGTEGVEGSVNLLGMPVGRAMMAFLITDTQGNVNPGIGGVGDLAIGPFGFGKVSFSGQNGATVNDVVVTALTSFFSTVQTLAPAVQTWVGGMLQEVAGLPAPPLNSALNATFTGLTQEQKLRLMSRFLGESKRLSLTVSDPVVRDQLFDAFAGIISSVLLAQETQLCVGGQLAPTLFGMPLTGGSDTLVGGGGSLKSVLESGQRYYEFTMQTTFSPTICSLYPILYSYATALPQLDEATLGFSVRIPSPTKPQVKLALTDPVQWAKGMAATLINDSVATANYEISPLGFRLEDVRARLILPRADKHPNNPASGWTAPPSGPGLATREEVVLAALDRGNLGNAQWRGNAGDLDDLFRGVPGGTQCSALTQQVATRLLAQDPTLATMSSKGFAADYFPHGGLIFGGQWQMPNVIAQAVPVQQIAAVLAGPAASGPATPQSILTWVNTTKDLIDNYLLATTCTGQLSGYVPAPSPVPAGVNWTALQNDPGQWLAALTNPSGLLGAAFPAGTSLGDNAAYTAWSNGRRAAVEGLLQKVVNRDALLNGIYPFNQSFFKGWCQAQLLGLPLGQAAASWDGTSKKLLITAQGSNASWLKDLVSANLILEVSPPQYVSAVNVPLPTGAAGDAPEERLAALRAQLDSVNTSNQAALAASLSTAILNVVPRLKLEASIDGTVPAAWQPYFSAGASASVVAYSPGFDLAAAGSTPEAAAKRNGGIALKGNLKFGPFIQSANAQASVLPGATGIPQLKADVSVSGLTIPGATPVTVLTADGRATFDSQSGSYTIDGHLSENLLLPAGLLPWQVTMPAATTSFHAAGNTLTFNFTFAGSAAAITVTWNGVTSTATYQGTVEFPPVYVPNQTSPVISLTGTGAAAPNIRVTVSNGTTGVMTNGQVRVYPFNQTAALPASFAGVEPDLDFPSFRSPASAATLNGFSLAGLQWEVSRVNGTFTVNNISAALSTIPGFAGTALNFAGGTLTPATGSYSLPASLPNLPGNGFTLRGPSGGNVSATLSSTTGLRAQIGQFSAGSVMSAAANVPVASLLIPAPGTAFTSTTWAASATSPEVPLMGGAGSLAAGAGTSITIDPDGGVDGVASRYYKVTGNLSAGVSVTANGWNVTMPAAAAVTVTNNNAAYSFTSAGIAASVAAGYSGGTPSFVFTGTLEIDPLVTDIFSIRPVAAAATKLALAITGGATATVAANTAKLRLAGPFNNLDITLPQLTLDTSYNFAAVTPSAVNATLKSYLLNSLTLSVRRVGGVIEVYNLACQLPAASGLPSVSLTGTLDRFGILNLASANLSTTLLGLSAAGTFTLGSPAGNYQDALLALAPEAWWKLDDFGTFSPTVDATGHGHTGSHTATVQFFQPAGVYPNAGTSYLFNGVDASVTVPDADTLEGGSAMAATAWFKVNAFDRSWQTIVSKGDDSWRIARDGGNNTIAFDSDHVTGSQYLAGVTPVNDGQWHHVAAVYDGARKYLYLDGKLENSAAMTGAINNSIHPVMIGENAQAAGRFWNGGIDEVAFFRRALSGGEVRNLYAAGVGAGLRFNGSMGVPGFTGASLAVNGSLSYDNAFTFSATLPQLVTGSFILTAPGGGPLSLTASNGGIAVPNSRLSLGSLFVPLDLPTFSIPANGEYNVSFTPPEFNLRGFSFPNPNLVFHRTGGITTLDLTGGAPALSGLPLLSLTGSINSAGSVTLGTGNTSQPFFGFNVAGTFDMGAPPQSAQSRVSVMDPEGWWTLDETNTFSDCPDSGPWGHLGAKSRQGMNNQTSALYPALGHSYNFNGISDYVTIPDDDYLEGDTAMTITAWVRAASLTRDWQAIVAKGDSSWRLSRYSNTNQVSFETTSGFAHDSLPSTVGINDGKWHQITGVFDGSFKYLYVDGRLENSHFYPVVIDRNAQPVMIGENSEARGRYWHGDIDEVVFFRRGLSPSEVRELYAAGNGLRFFFNGNASLPGIDPSVSGSISAGGGFDFATSFPTSPTIFNYGFNNASFLFQHFEGAGGAAFTGSLRLNTIPTFGSYAPLNGTPVFKAVFTRENAANPPAVNVQTRATLSADDLSLNLCGYAPAGPGFDLRLTGFPALFGSPSLTFSDFRFAPFPIDALNTGFPALSGTIGTGGQVAVTGAAGTTVSSGAFYAPLNLRNMIALNTWVRFNHSGLYIDAPFELKTTEGGFSHTWAWIGFSGFINPAGSYSLGGSGALSFGTHSTDSFNMRFRSADYSGGTVVPDGVTPNLNFGNLDVSVTVLSIHQNGHAVAFGGKSGDKVDHWLYDNPPPPNAPKPHLKTTFHYDVGFGFNFNSRTVTASMNGGATWTWEVENFAPPPGWPSSGSFGIFGSIADGGNFTVNNASASGTNFWAPYWDSGGWWPPPAWGWGNIGSVDYDLW